IVRFCCSGTPGCHTRKSPSRQVWRSVLSAPPWPGLASAWWLPTTRWWSNVRNSVRPHLPEEELHAWLDKQLSRAQSREIAEHLMACLICRALEAEVRGLRDRTTALLAIAAPRNIQGMPAASRGAVGPNRRQLRRGSMVAA